MLNTYMRVCVHAQAHPMNVSGNCHGFQFDDFSLNSMFVQYIHRHAQIWPKLIYE